MGNRFRDPTLRKEYDVAVKVFELKHRDLFTSDGKQHVGSSFAELFWKGYNGVMLNWDRASRETLAYAYWRAGQDCRRGKEKSCVPK